MAKLANFTKDSTNAEIKNLIQDITDHKLDIIIGTQMITKGYHFPKLKNDFKIFIQINIELVDYKLI